MNINRLKNEYPNLSRITMILKILGIIIIVFAIIGFFYGISLLDEYGDEKTFGIYIIITSLISGLLFSIPFLAFAELIQLLVRIEFNTRNESEYETIRTNDNLKQKNNNPEKPVLSFDEWKKDNPTKSLNDYYAAIRKK